MNKKVKTKAKGSAKTRNAVSRRTLIKPKPKKKNTVAVGRRVLETEIDGLKRLSASLGETLEIAIEHLLLVKGRIIVSGIGKSGHVARKVAATLASTGTPAHFVHPSEASHGDLGMITSNDAVLVFSNSGMSPELADILAHCRRYGILLIGVSARSDSILMEHATIALALPPSREACPMGLSPTTSTTQMMALGDVVAVALMERRGFTSDDYRILHPGGTLGKALLRVSDIMHEGKALPLGPETMLMSEALLVMTAKRFGCIGIINPRGDLVGIITDGDLRRHMSDKLLKKSVRDIMTRRPKMLRAGTLIVEAVRMFNEAGILCAFVASDEEGKRSSTRPIGFLHMHDCLRAGAG